MPYNVKKEKIKTIAYNLQDSCFPKQEQSMYK